MANPATELPAGIGGSTTAERRPMAHAEPQLRMTPAEYLEWEATQEERHEYIDGEVYGMAGANDRHMTVTGNVYMALRLHLRGSPCHTFAMDVRLNAATSNAYFYPDVMVTCHPDDHASRLAKSHPVLIVEVASPSTAAHDLGAKFAHYRLIDALREYVVVDVDRLSADVYRRSEQGDWTFHPSQGDQPVTLASVGLELPMAELFADLPPAEESSDETTGGTSGQ